MSLPDLPENHPWLFIIGSFLFALIFFAASYTVTQAYMGPAPSGTVKDAPVFSPLPAVTPVPATTSYPAPLRASTVPPWWATQEPATQAAAPAPAHTHTTAPAPTTAPPTPTPTVTPTPSPSVTSSSPAPTITPTLPTVTP